VAAGLQLKFLWELFLVPLAEEMAPSVRAALDRSVPMSLPPINRRSLAGLWRSDSV
jgi:hypothetical protein